MKIAMAQMNVQSGKCEANFQKIKSNVELAKQEGADMIVFPEMCISGVLMADKWKNHEFCEYVHSFNERIKELSEGIGIVFGNLYYDTIYGINQGKDGMQARYNAVLFAYQGKWVPKENGELDGVHIKCHNQNEYWMDDSRYFVSAFDLLTETRKEIEDITAPFLFVKEGKNYRIGLTVGENLYDSKCRSEIVSLYHSQDCDFIVNVSANPWTLEQDKKTSICEAEIPFLCVNACGIQNTGKNIVLFDGSSCVLGKDGKVVYSLNDRFEEELAIYDFKKENNPKMKSGKLLDALSFAIKQSDLQMFNGKVKWIIGLSGGIDSCINACLLVKALGSERVIGYNMASAYNSLTTKNNARILAEALGIEIREGSIELLNQASLDTMHMYGYDDSYHSLVYENIQARIRGHLLSTFASIEGGVIINNANKIEAALGYCTLYGDAIGALSPLGDLTKVQCFELAKECNEYFGKEVISKTLIPEVINDEICWEMPPSAELKDAQFDPMKWFYHDEIIRMLFDEDMSVEDFMLSYLNESIYETPLGKWIRYYHLEDPKAFIEDLEWVIRTLNNTVFKRIQMPPIVAVSKGAFGSFYRETQTGWIKTSHYEQLRERILQK